MANGTNGRNGISVSELKAEQFANAYIKHNCNGVRALRSIGRKGKANGLATDAWKLLRNPKVQEVLANLRHEMSMGTLEAIQRMTDIARGSLDFFLDKGGHIDILKARRLGKLHLAKKVRQRTRTQETEDGPITTVEVEVEVYPADAALTTMMKFHKLLDVTLPKIRDPRDLDQILHDELLRVHGRDKGLELSKALGLKVAPGVH